MKSIELKKITLINFKGEEKREIVFQKGTHIFGGNGTGKSRIMDAYLWCLLGKDAQNRTDFEVRTRKKDGTLLYKTECSVTIVLSVDEREYTLKRQLKDKWIMPRGEEEEVFSGNTTECWIDGTPLTIGEYEKFVSSIAEGNTFKILSMPLFFCEMDWRIQREILFQIAKQTTNEELAEGNEDYLLLLDKMGGKSLAEFRKELGAKIRLLEKDLLQFDPKIEQVKSMMPTAKDWTSIRAEIVEKEKQISILNSRLTDEANRKNIYNKEYNETLLQIENKEMECKSALLKAQKKEEDKHNNIIKEYQKQVDEVTKAIYEIDITVASLNRKIEDIKRALPNIEQALKQKREEYSEVFRKEFASSGLCPTCKQALPKEMIEKEKELFLKKKNEKLQEITNKGKEYANEIRNKKEEVIKLTEKIASYTKEKETIEKKRKEIISKLDNQKELSLRILTMEDVDTCKTLQKEIEAKKEESKKLLVVDDAEVVKELEKDKAEIMAERDKYLIILKDEQIIEQYNKEIETLISQSKEKQREIAEAKREEYIAKCFTEKKIKDCEEKINSLFKLVKFNLFFSTLDGNIKESCAALIDGVPIKSVNTAMQINGGLDIINTLSKFFGIELPIFIDNRESVNNIIDTNGQVINLIVTQEQELTIKYYNK